MSTRLLLATLAALLIAQAQAQAQAQASARPGAGTATRDWTRVIVATPEGGVRMGNPDAPVKLVEYASITCPHCAHFAAEGAPTLEGTLVRSGRVSWEYRPYLLFPTDPGIFMLLRCQGAAGFFPTLAELYATQSTWAGRVDAYLQSLSAEERERLQAMSVTQRIVALTRASGVDQVFLRRGMTAGRIDACLADQAGLAALAEVTREARDRFEVMGTPGFLLNGRRLDGVYDWAALWPHLAPR